MPKMKTRKAVKKRFRMTGRGKFLKSRALRRHLLGDRPSNRKRKLRRANLVKAVDAGRIRSWFPYG